MPCSLQQPILPADRTVVVFDNRHPFHTIRFPVKLGKIQPSSSSGRPPRPEIFRPQLFAARKIILPLPPHRFPVPPSTRGRGLKGNAVKIGNSSRCCKFPERGSPPPHRVPAIFATGHRAGKAPEQERVRRPARAFTDSLLRRMEANTGGFLHPRNRRIVTGRQTLRHSHPPVPSALRLTNFITVE